MRDYIKPEIVDFNIDELSIFNGCKSWTDDDDSCYAGDD